MRRSEGFEAPVLRIGTPLTGRGIAKNEELRRKAFPRTNADSKRNPLDNGWTWGDFLRVHGPLLSKEGQPLEGKFESGFLILLGYLLEGNRVIRGHIRGDIRLKTGLGLNLRDNVSNFRGVTTAIVGSGDGFITPVEVSRWGYPETIELILNGYFTLVERIVYDESGKIVPKPDSFWDRYLTAERAYLDPKSGGYNIPVQKLYRMAFAKAIVLRPVFRRMGLIAHTTRVFTASVEANVVETDRPLFERSKKIFQELTEKGVKSPFAGPAVVLRHENGRVRKIIARFWQLDGRSEKEKNSELPPAPVIRKTSHKEFWEKRWKKLNRLARRANQRLHWINLDRARRHKKPRPLIEEETLLPEVPVWTVEQGTDGQKVECLYMKSIIFCPGQPDRQIVELKQTVETDEEFHARMFRTYGISPGRHVSIDGFYLWVPTYKGTGKIDILDSPKRRERSPEEILEAIRQGEFRNLQALQQSLEQPSTENRATEKEVKLPRELELKLLRQMKPFPKASVPALEPPTEPPIRQVVSEKLPPIKELEQPRSGALRWVGDLARRTYVKQASS